MRRIFPLIFLLLSFVATQAQTLLSESFDVTATTSTLPVGWTLVNTSGSTNGCWGTGWNRVVSGGFVCSSTFPQPNPATHSGTGMAGYNSWDIYMGGVSELVSPVLDFSAAGTNSLSFWVYNYAGFYLHDSIRVYVNTSGGSSGGTMLFALDPVYNPSPTGWTQYTVTIPTTYTGTTNYIIFRGHSDYGYDVFIDDVSVVHNPPTPCTGTPLTPSITTAPMTVATPVCGGSSKTLNATDPNFPTIGGIAYQWQSSPTGLAGSWTNVTAGTGGTTLNYNTGPLAASTYYRMGATCTSSALAAYSAAYFVPVGAPQPGTISGNASFCPGDAATYSVTNVSGTTYAWTLPGGWSGSSISNTINVTPGATAGNISVTATTSCGTSAPQTKAVVFGSAPSAPVVINGPSSACVNSTQTYSITGVAGATTYAWTVPIGWTINSTAANGLSINVTTNASSGNVSVSASNGCGSNSQSLAVTVISSLPNPGVISGASTPCSGALYSYSISPVPGATSYQWVLPSGWSGTISGTTIQTYAGTSGGNLTVTAVSACAVSPTATLATTVTPSVTPTVSVQPSSTLICQNTSITFTAAVTNAGSSPTYIWKKNGAPVIASGATYVDNKLTTGDAITVSLVSNAVCRTKDTTQSAPYALNVTPQALPGISINSTPVVTACAGTTFSFSTVTYDGGSTPGYQWFVNSVAIPAATSASYSSGALATNDTISVRLTTSALCPNAPIVLSNRVVVNIINRVFPTITIAASSNTATPGTPITFTAAESGGGATPMYQWFLNGVAIAGETAATFTSTTLMAADHVSVRMQSYAPCANPDYVTSNEIILGGTTGIAGLRGWEGTISLYPNPNTGQFTVAATTSVIHSGKSVLIEVQNVVGQSVYRIELAPDKVEWNKSIRLGDGVANGHYILRLSSADGMRANVPFILNR